MRTIAAVLALAAAALVPSSAGACDYTNGIVVNQQALAVQAQVPAYNAGPSCGVCAAASVQSYVPTVVQSAPLVYNYTPPVRSVVSYNSYAVQAQPIYRTQFVQSQKFVQRNVFHSQKFVQRPAFVQQPVFVQRNVVRGGFGGGFAGGPFRQGFQQGGILGGLERFTGLGNGSGDFGRGAIIGILGARSNLFGLGR
jgi:hypothetical protein